MSIFYQRVIAIALMVASCYLVQAQKLAGKTDKIHRLDKTVIENVLVTEVNKTEIRYAETREPSKIYIVSRKEIWKIEWNTGESEEITPRSTPAVPKPVKATDLLVRKTTITKLFWEKEGAYWGIAAAGGLGFPVKSDGKLVAEKQLAYSGGLVLGYHRQAVGIQLEGLYTKTRYQVVISEAQEGAIQHVQGYQSQLLLPLQVSLSRKFGYVRLGITAGGYANILLGGGSLKVDYPDGKSTHTRNCATCPDEKSSFGLTSGLALTLIENTFYTFYVNARYYHALGNNSDFRVGETAVQTSAIMAGGGILFHFPKSGGVK